MALSTRAFCSMILAAMTMTAATGIASESAATKKPHILLIHDMEGLSGQDDPYSFVFGHPKYAETRKLLTADVNAVIDGLFAGGAGAVSVADGHGSGNSEPDLLLDRLDVRAVMVSRPDYFDTYLDLAARGAFDAVAVVGMHSKSGSKGFAAHTYTVGTEIEINGHSITETELVGLLYGRVGIPVIFASGDDRLGADLKTMPWIQFVTTKKAQSAAAVELLPVTEVHAALTKQARIAVRQLASAQAMSLAAPIQVKVRAVPPASMSWLQDFPGVDYKDESVSFTAPDMAAAYISIRPIVGAMRPSFAAAERSVLNRHPDGKRLRYEGHIELFRRWLEAETGGVKSAPPPSGDATGDYHGFY